MMRPNLAQDKPPVELSIGGHSYSINTDFRVWIGVLHDLRNIYPAPKNAEQAYHNADTFARIEKAVFGKIINENLENILAAITEFAKGYPEPPIGEGGGPAVQTYSLDWDINYIIVAIGTQFGIDLTYRKKGILRRKRTMHFWEFMLYFRALCGDHYILRLMEIRGYKGNDSELKRQAQRFALPREQTVEDEAMSDIFNELFYNA